MATGRFFEAVSCHFSIGKIFYVNFELELMVILVPNRSIMPKQLPYSKDAINQWNSPSKRIWITNRDEPGWTHGDETANGAAQ